MRAPRRRFLATAAAATALGLAEGSLPGFAAEEQPPPEPIRFSPDIEPLVSLIEDTPREKCAEALAAKLKAGLPYRQLLAATFLSAVRKQNPHHSVYQVFSAHQTSLDLPRNENLLPLFWAVDHFKWHQLADPTPKVAALRGPLPPPERAASQFHQAMKQMDSEGAERAIVALARSEGPLQAMEVLWHYSCRDCGAIGHRAIAVASCWRVLEVLDWQHAEPVLRFVVRELMDVDQYYLANVARSEALSERLPFGWATGNPDSGPTKELFALMRQGKSGEASELVGKLLLSGVGSQPIWDAIHTVAADMLIVHPGQSGMGGRAVHVNTAANALHYAFRTTKSSTTRLLILLQAAAWMGDFVRGQLGANNLSESKPVDLAGSQPRPDAAEMIAEVFASIPPHEYIYDYRTRIGVGHRLPDKAKRAEPAKQIYALLINQPEAAGLFTATARSWLCLKASIDSHEFKLPAALFEDYELVSRAWRPRLLAASVHWLHGKRSEDSLPIHQAAEVLGIRG